MKPETVIGLECHLPLDCASKLFCGCKVAPNNAEPNSSTCPVCLGFPGSRPVLNKKAVEFAVKLAIALNCEISGEFFFSRKTYFYPDLAKNFQITQFEFPLGKNGLVRLSSGKKIRIARLHIEEDPGALVHEGRIGTGGHVLVDYNRSGNPLVEIVTEPDLSSIEEVKEFFSKLKSVAEYLEVFDGQKSVIKADTNISLKGHSRVEIKNVTGTKNIEKAVEFEVARQQRLLMEGKKIERETRGFDEETSTTFSLRMKETEADYGFIGEPDLPKIVLDKKWLKELHAGIPEFAEQKAERFVKKLGLNEYDAGVIAQSKALSNIFEETIKTSNAVLASRFFSREILGILNYNGFSPKETRLSPKEISQLLNLLEKNAVSEKNSKEAMINYILKGVSPKEFLLSKNLLLDVKGKAVEEIVLQVLQENPSAVNDLKKGKTKALNFLVGLVMRRTKGKTSPKEVQKIIEKKVLGK